MIKIILIDVFVFAVMLFIIFVFALFSVGRKKVIPEFIRMGGATCEIKRLVHDVDHDMGASPGEFVTVASGVICALDRVMSTSRNYSGGLERSLQGEIVSKTFKLFLSSAGDILEGDHVIIGGVVYKTDDVIKYASHIEAILTI